MQLDVPEVQLSTAGSRRACAANKYRALTTLKLKHEGFDWQNAPTPQADAYRSFIKKNLVAGHGVARMIMLRGGAYPIFEDGVRVFEDRLDDGTTIRLRLEIAGEHAKVDFTGTDEVIPSNLNATSAIVSSAVLYCFRCLIGRDIPLNSGVLAPIEIVLSTCFLSPPAEDDPRDCAAVAGGNVETSQRVVDVMLGALGQVAASQGTMNNLLFGNESFGYYETICGGAGAGPNGDGADAVHTHMTNTRITDPEVLEQRFPARLRRFEIRPSSGGEGLHRGGDGVVREIEFLEEVEVSILSQRRETRPYGLEGGGPGSSGVNRLRRAGGADWETLAGNVTFRASAGDIVRIETPGGGAWKPVPTSAEDAAQRSHQ